jgi:hypothetical protein
MSILLQQLGAVRLNCLAYTRLSFIKNIEIRPFWVVQEITQLMPKAKATEKSV